MIEPVPFFWPLICSVAAKRTVAAVQSVSCVFRDPTGTIYSMTLPLSRSIVASTAGQRGHRTRASRKSYAEWRGARQKRQHNRRGGKW